jgi:uroporphyrinogen-III decarboxylase
MTSKQRFLAVLEGKLPDRLPVTTHHVQSYFLEKYLNGISTDDFFDRFGLDPICWCNSYKPDAERGQYFDPDHMPGNLDARRIATDDWRIESEIIPDDKYKTERYSFITPDGTLSTLLQSNEYTSWVTERLIKNKNDIDIIAQYAPSIICDIEKINHIAESYGERGIVRGLINFFEVYGQSGCWQDAAVLYGIENLIMATFEDPDWVHRFLQILFERKKIYVRSLKGAKYDLIEHGGGDASSTVISPQIFEKFVAPYDAPLIDIAHAQGQRIVYHTCGGMMPILEIIADMKPDAMETFTPPAMGGDVNLMEAKARIGRGVCMIGGFDQFHFFNDCTEEQVRAEVRRCFNEAGEGGRYILSPSDHFFDADVKLIEAFADEARKCVYK